MRYLGWKNVAGALLGIALAACNGSVSTDATRAGEPAALRQLAQRTPSQQAQASPITPDQLMDWAEALLPGLFPSHATTSAGNGFVYRYYAEGSNFIAVANDGGVYLVLASTGGQLSYLGPLTSFACDVAGTCTTGALSLLAGAVGGGGHIDGLGTTARFTEIRSLATDGQGNVYAADRQDGTIRKMTPQGLVTTLAGKPGRGDLTSIDGTGSAARFGFVRALTADSAGNVYAADLHSIRKITPAGLVTTLAGQADATGSVDGAGSVARFTQPDSLGVDGAGNVYVWDSGAVRKVTPAGVVSTLAGQVGAIGYVDAVGTAARFDSTEAIAVDKSGNVYLGGLTNKTIRRLTPDGSVSTVAGQRGVIGGTDGSRDVATLTQPTALALDGAGNLYVIDFAALRKVAPDGSVTTLAGIAGSSGIGADPSIRFTGSSVTVDGQGRVYVGTVTTLRRMLPSGRSAVMAGADMTIGMDDGTGGKASFRYPGNMARDTTGNLYVVDDHSVRKISPQGVVTTLAGSGAPGTADGLGGAASLAAPAAVAVDKVGNVYFTDTDYNFGPAPVPPVLTNTIRKITPTGQMVTLAGAPGAGGFADGPGAQARFSRPYGLALDADGNLAVADCSNHAVRKVAPDGTVSTLTGTPGVPGATDGASLTARFNCPNGVAFDAEGNLYVVDSGNATVRKVTPAGMVSTLAGTAGATGWVDGTGAAARFTRLFSLTVDTAGNVYVNDVYPGSSFVKYMSKAPVSDFSGNIRKITPQGVVTTIAGNVDNHGIQLGRLPASLYEVNGLVSDGAGALFVATGTAVLKLQLP